MLHHGDSYGCSAGMHDGECQPAWDDVAALDKCRGFRRARRKGESVKSKAMPTAKCLHLGPPTGETVACSNCPSATNEAVHHCLGGRGKCVPGAASHVGGLTACARCSDRSVDERVVPERVVKVLDEHFNGSLLWYNGKLLLASRLGWVGSRTFLHELDQETLQPIWSRDLRIQHPAALSGAEDPRLFMHAGRLHVAITGYEKIKEPATSQLLATLDDSLHVDAVWAPHYARRRGWEKNWSFFSRGDDLCCVYTIDQHVVLRMDGPDAVEESRVRNPHSLPGAFMRGGCPPVLIDGEWYHWYHAVRQLGNTRTYTLELYTFDAAPPHAPRRRAPGISWSDPDKVTPPWGKDVTFPCGAVLHGGKWLVSYGWQDRGVRVAVLDADQVGRALR